MFWSLGVRVRGLGIGDIGGITFSRLEVYGPVLTSSDMSHASKLL